MKLALRLHRISCRVPLVLALVHGAAHLMTSIQGPGDERERRVMAALQGFTFRFSMRTPRRRSALRM
jgi:hypothetical protein